MNFVDPGLDPGLDPVTSGKVVKSIPTKILGVVASPSNGWAHWVHRPDFADLLGCGSDGSIYTIDFNQFNNVPDGTAALVRRPVTLPDSIEAMPASCVALGWDPAKRT